MTQTLCMYKFKGEPFIGIVTPTNDIDNVNILDIWPTSGTKWVYHTKRRSTQKVIYSIQDYKISEFATVQETIDEYPEYFI